MARKNIIPKTVYIPDESQDMWLLVKDHIGMESDSAVLWDLVKAKFHEIKDGKTKRQAMQDVVTGMADVNRATTTILDEVLFLKTAIAAMQERLCKIEEKIEEHGFD